jgi:hypothetical protein
MTTMAVKDRDEVMRSPAVLKPLIESQVELGFRAGVSFFKRAGVLLLEARDGIKSDQAWARYVEALRPDGMRVAPQQATQWMRLGRSERLGLGHTSVDSARRDPRTRRRSPHDGRGGAGRSTSSDQVDQAEAHRRAEQADFHEQRRQERAEMLLLIDAGYKAMAMKRHPDKGGGKDAMTLLKEVRDILRKYAEGWS